MPISIPSISAEALDPIRMPNQYCSKEVVLRHLAQFGELKTTQEVGADKAGLESIVLLFVEYGYDEVAQKQTSEVCFEEYWLNPGACSMYPPQKIESDGPHPRPDSWCGQDTSSTEVEEGQPRIVTFSDKYHRAPVNQGGMKTGNVVVSFPNQAYPRRLLLKGGQNAVVSHPFNGTSSLIEYLSASDTTYWRERGFMKEMMLLEKTVAASGIYIPPTAVNKTIVVSQLKKPQTQGMMRGSIFG